MARRRRGASAPRAPAAPSLPTKTGTNLPSASPATRPRRGPHPCPRREDGGEPWGVCGRPLLRTSSAIDNANPTQCKHKADPPGPSSPRAARDNLRALQALEGGPTIAAAPYARAARSNAAPRARAARSGSIGDDGGRRRRRRPWQARGARLASRGRGATRLRAPEEHGAGRLAPRPPWLRERNRALRARRGGGTSRPHRAAASGRPTPREVPREPSGQEGKPACPPRARAALRRLAPLTTSGGLRRTWRRRTRLPGDSPEAGRAGRPSLPARAFATPAEGRSSGSPRRGTRDVRAPRERRGPPGDPGALRPAGSGGAPRRRR